MYVIPNWPDPNAHDFKWTRFQMKTILNEHDPEWVRLQMFTIPNGRDFEWIQSRIYLISNGRDSERHNFECTISRMDTNLNDKMSNRQKVASELTPMLLLSCFKLLKCLMRLSYKDNIFNENLTFCVNIGHLQKKAKILRC